MRRGALPGQQEPEHWRSIVHHDLKPDNIFMSKPDDQVWPGIPILMASRSSIDMGPTH